MESVKNGKVQLKLFHLVINYRISLHNSSKN